jgi:Na+/H+ antiporter NhaD/arsenite permease-like protein
MTLAPEILILILLVSFISGAMAAVASAAIMIIMKRMNYYWEKNESVRLPYNVVRRGTYLAIGPILFAIADLVRIFLIIKTGQDISFGWFILSIFIIGVYSLTIPLFIYSFFNEMIVKPKSTKELP